MNLDLYHLIEDLKIRCLNGFLSLRLSAFSTLKPFVIYFRSRIDTNESNCAHNSPLKKIEIFKSVCFSLVMAIQCISTGLA